MKDKLIKYEFVFYRFVLSVREKSESFIQRDILSRKRGEIFES